MHTIRRIATPLGELCVAGSAGFLTAMYFADQRRPPTLPPHTGHEEEADPILTVAASELARYFDGDPAPFTLPLAPHGTPFQRRVWQALTEIPYGRTVSYGEIAARVEHPRAVRAVGAAIGRNPLCIVIPCHRVIGASGALTGYAGGMARKRALLALERGGARLPLADAA